MAKAASDEIDTIFEVTEGTVAANAADRVKSLSADISLGSELESSKTELNEAAAAAREDLLLFGFSPPGLLHPERDPASSHSNRRGQGHRLFYLHPVLRQQAQRRRQRTRLAVQQHAV